jgi:hypothetical protein
MFVVKVSIINFKGTSDFCLQTSDKKNSIQFLAEPFILTIILHSLCYYSFTCLFPGEGYFPHSTQISFLITCS